jgi:hypothetical protein
MTRDSSVDAGFSPQAYARLAGLLYLVVIIGGIVAELVVRQRLVVPNDPAATASNILAHEQLFRWGFAAELIAGLCVVPLILLLYEIFKVVNPRIALLAVFFSLVGGGIEGAALLGHFEPLILLTSGGSLGPPEALQTQAYVALRMQSIGFAAALTFFGGTMLSRGYLILRSTFFPRFIGVLLAIEGVCYIANSFAKFVAPQFAPALFQVLMVSGLAEVILTLWLLVKGIDVPKWQLQRA